MSFVIGILILMGLFGFWPAILIAIAIGLMI